MKDIKKLTGLLFIVTFLGNAALCRAELKVNPKTIKAVNFGVYEIMVLKPVADSMTYEKPLPLELIPYEIRNDKYYSVGSAFCIEDSLFLSAAHVFGMSERSQYDNVYLRDHEGIVYEINKIRGYSSRRDVIIFTIKGNKPKQSLKVNHKYELNKPIFAVGNALGEGIVIRDGLLVSTTLEPENGEWEMLRFSAAASPGNSGGPLLDKNGKVLGIVTMKSENENLNYAIPIAEAIKYINKDAEVYNKVIYQLPNANMQKMRTLSEQIKLPADYASFRKQVEDRYISFCQELLDTLLGENKNDFFPNGQTSLSLLYSTYRSFFPDIISQGKDGNWGAYAPSDINKADLGKNGYFNYGNLSSGNTVIYLQKPDDISLQKLYSDSKLLMDLLLQGFQINRNIGNTETRITSMGTAVEDYVHIDKYRRKWLVRSWLMQFSDEKVLTFSLPTPGGMIMILRIGQTGAIDSGILPDFKLLADMVYLSYYGTFEQWKEFLARNEFLPEGFSGITFSYNTPRGVYLKTSRLNISYNKTIMDFDDESDLSLRFSYFPERDQVIWDIAGVVFGENKNSNNNFSIFRKINPAPELKDDFKSTWDKLTNGRYPYDNKSYYNDGNTIISGLHNKFVHRIPALTANQLFLYYLNVYQEGKIPDGVMKKKLKLVDAAVKITE